MTDSLQPPDFAAPLSHYTVGTRCLISTLKGQKDLCRKLREMGIREGLAIELIIKSRNCVCLVGGTRFALNEHFAQCIYVTPQTLDD